MRQDLAIKIEFQILPKLSAMNSPQNGEWPPHPDRFFQACVATAAETAQDMSVLKALESQPDILASDAVCDKTPLRYVPENFRRSSGYHTGAAQYSPTVLPEIPSVYYIWRNVETELIPNLTAIVGEITHLGRASSMVIASVIDANTINPNLAPLNGVLKGGEINLRCPYAGRLEELKLAYNAGQRSPQAQYVPYQTINSISPNQPWEDLIVLRPPTQLDGVHSTFWCDKIRRIVMSTIETDIPSIISGHNEDGNINHLHVAWSAIPNVGNKHAHGEILGLGCWIPKGIDDRSVSLLWRALTSCRLDGQKLEADSSDLKSLRFETWSAASKRWATATPIALDRWPKKHTPIETVITNSILNLGLPAPSKVECNAHSFFNGAIPTFKYKTRHGRRFLTHAIIEWDQPVQGPILIGAERYFGSGLCRPILS